MYDDVAAAIIRGEIASAAEHYVVSGAVEGRFSNAAARPLIEAWMIVLRDQFERALL